MKQRKYFFLIYLKHSLLPILIQSGNVTCKFKAAFRLFSQINTIPLGGKNVGHWTILILIVCF